MKSNHRDHDHDQQDQQDLHIDYLQARGLTNDTVLFQMTTSELMDSLFAQDITEQDVYSDMDRTWIAVEMHEGKSFNEAVEYLELEQVQFSGSPEVDSEEEKIWMAEREAKSRRRYEQEQELDTLCTLDTPEDNK